MGWGTSSILPRFLRREVFSSGQSEAQTLLQDEGSRCQGTAPGGKLLWGICHCPPWFLEKGAIKLPLLLELCPPHHQTCKWPLCSHTFDSLSPVLMDRYMGEVRSCHGRTASWGHGARTRCLPWVGASGRGGVDAPVVAGRLAVQLLNLAGTDLHQSYGCVWGKKSLVGFD